MTNWTGRLALVALLCASTPLAAAPIATTKPPEMRMAADSQAFARWRNSFRGRALAAGIRPRVFDAAFQGIGINRRVIELDGRQAEFTKTLEEYLNSTVPTSRVNEGRRKARTWRTTLSEIQQKYRVDASVVMGIWGIETNYGGFMGGTKVIEGLATLAYEGRRRKWAERELIAALRIIQSGDTVPARMEGSWAGAMGHTQFMPTSYQAYAVDFQGDGKRDVWADNPGDALASAANYLREHGWTFGQPWGIEVQLPAGFNYATANPRPGRPVSQWNRAGVRDMDGKEIPNYGKAGLWVPTGARGPAFLVFDNFFVIKRYNNADAYALAVGHLGDRIYGEGPIKAKWPKVEKPLSRSETRQLQRLLTSKGFDTKGVDGLIGPNSVAAIRRFQKRIGVTQDGHPSRDLLRRLQ